ncbi:DNA ligase D [Chthonobacter albigriseus]|uniref:DNA ligase D n=1 Tax=Chthonobacter albigriseus TaxID=1683161 RepID=UPI0015EF7BB7|nr:DNA ligase D [Chthonobacter albigriseus]
MARAAGKSRTSDGPSPSPAARPTSPEEALASYRAKRDFSRTAEPAEGGLSGKGLFVVQHHWARREHYDFRLELDGVLLSFAVTKGPSLNPSDRRLAVRTEDHPISYAEFEGTIPKGEYGGGTVMLWDRGVWAPMTDDPHAALQKGELKFVLLGERMKGAWVLVRMNVEKGRENWLLIKEKDEWVDREVDDYPAKYVTSIKTGRTKEEIEQEETPHSFARDRAEAEETGRPSSAPKAAAVEPLPFVPPTLCSVRKSAPEGDDWIHEIKYDGYRLQAAVSGETVHLYTREGLDWAKRFPSVRNALSALDLSGVLLDGEAVVFDARGLTDFPGLVDALDGPGTNIAYVVFDILFAAGEDLRKRPLLERKDRLADVLGRADGQTIRIAPFMTGNGPTVFGNVVGGGAEGIISKRADSPYVAGRTSVWAKVKGENREDVIVVGMMPSDKRAFASLHCAIEDGDGLRYVGGVGTGFSAAELERIAARLEPDRRKGPPPGLKGTEKAPRTLRWVEPKYRIEVQLAGWTGDGSLRQARYLGWREDRAPLADAAPKPRAKTLAARQAKEPSVTSDKPKPARRAAKPKAVSAERSAMLSRISHPERVVFPEIGGTKLQVAEHYLAVADRIMPHLLGRPVSFVRAPEGLSGETFFQRHVLPGMKKGVKPVHDPESRHEDYLTITDVEGLVTAAQFGVIELHGWNAVVPKLKSPDRMVFDFDPDEDVGFEAVKEAAFAVRQILDAVGLASYPMASGGKGLHVLVPLDATQTFDDIGDFTGGVAKGMAKAEPKRYVAVASKERRKGRIYVDWLRNRPYSTAIVPWSLRARATASVAVPLDWDEVADLEAPNMFGMAEAAERPDPWTDFFTLRQRIDDQALKFLKASLKG